MLVRYSIRFVFFFVFLAALLTWGIQKNSESLQFSSQSTNSDVLVKIEFLHSLSNMHLYFGGEEVCQIPSQKGTVVEVRISRRFNEDAGSFVVVTTCHEGQLAKQLGTYDVLFLDDNPIASINLDLDFLRPTEQLRETGRKNFAEFEFYNLNGTKVGGGSLSLKRKSLDQVSGK